MIEYIICTCGETIESNTEMTPDENQKYNCSRGCCAEAYQCKICGKRIIIKHEAPEA
ncbi:MAG: hypothetical protein GY861_02990 [bacterium]|nr:hypothetical protein [bacterium]